VVVVVVPAVAVARGGRGQGRAAAASPASLLLLLLLLLVVVATVRMRMRTVRMLAVVPVVAPSVAVAAVSPSAGGGGAFAAEAEAGTKGRRARRRREREERLLSPPLPSPQTLPWSCDNRNNACPMMRRYPSRCRLCLRETVGESLRTCKAPGREGRGSARRQKTGVSICLLSPSLSLAFILSRFHSLSLDACFQSSRTCPRGRRPGPGRGRETAAARISSSPVCDFLCLFDDASEIEMPLLRARKNTQTTFF